MHLFGTVRLTGLVQCASGRADGIGLIASPELSIIRCAQLGMYRGPPQISIGISFPTFILYFSYLSVVETLRIWRESLCNGLSWLDGDRYY